MTGREKVTKGLECCLQTDSTVDCQIKECPYHEWREACTEMMMKSALSLLKEQEPIAPKLIKMYPHDIYECGNCGHRSVGSKDYKAKYCPECGRTLKWK